MYILADGHSMYASVEKVFDPSLRKSGCIVLSNNDGAVVAACSIAKKAGVGKKFVPYFQVKDDVAAAGVGVRSSNYALYADLSMRMMDTLSHFSPNFYSYSIDEGFLHYGNYRPPGQTWIEHAREIRRKVWDEVRIPIGVGVGPTPTLAKAANHASKRIEGYRGLAVIDDEISRKYILSRMEVTDVWGIGKRIGARLNDLGIRDALTLSEQDPKRMRRRFSINVEKTVSELAGHVRLSWDEVRSPKKEIYSTRSFGQRITEEHVLKEALSTHAEIVGSKLRRQSSVAGGMSIFATSSPHDNTGFFRRSTFHEFTIPTMDTRNMVKAITEAMPKLYKPGVRYYRCGVGLLDLSSEDKQQYDLFESPTDNKPLMELMDSINARYGRSTIHLAAKGIDQKFAMKRQLLSSQYTTRWADIPVFKC